MPTITRLFLKFGLVYFVASMACGVAMAWAEGAWAALLLPTYLHLFVVGWITQIIIGVALWLFPKQRKDKPRGHEWLSWTALVTLNVGLLLRAVAEPAQFALEAGSGWQPTMDWLLVASAALQWIGGMAFLANIWGRIKPKKKRRSRRNKKKQDKTNEDKKKEA
jgi:Trk-type K+ transport system membrane component